MSPSSFQYIRRDENTWRCVLRVPDFDPLRQPGELRVALQAAQRQSVKGVDPQIRARAEVEVTGDPAAHLVGGLAREGYGEDARWSTPLSRRCRKRPTSVAVLPAPGPREHELDGTFGAGGASLGRIERCHRSSCHNRRGLGNRPSPDEPAWGRDRTAGPAPVTPRRHRGATIGTPKNAAFLAAGRAAMRIAMRISRPPCDRGRSGGQVPSACWRSSAPPWDSPSAGSTWRDTAPASAVGRRQVALQ